MARKRQFQFVFEVPAEDGLIGNKVLLHAVNEKKAIMSARSWLDLHLRDYGFLQRIGSCEWTRVTCSGYFL